MIFNRQLLKGNLSTTLIISGVLLLLGITYILFIVPNLGTPSTSLWMGDGIFKARLAINDNDRIIGLSNRKEFKTDQALIMAYSSDNMWGIWMKDMNFPIDVVWLDKNKSVTSIVKNINPSESTSKTHLPKKPSRYIVELPAGTVDSKAINIGAKAVFQIDESKVK